MGDRVAARFARLGAAIAVVARMLVLETLRFGLSIQKRNVLVGPKFRVRPALKPSAVETTGSG